MNKTKEKWKKKDLKNEIPIFTKTKKKRKETPTKTNKIFEERNQDSHDYLSVKYILFEIIKWNMIVITMPVVHWWPEVNLNGNLK